MIVPLGDASPLILSYQTASHHGQMPRGRTQALEAVIQQRRMTAPMSDFSSFGQEQGILDVNM